MKANAYVVVSSYDSPIAIVYPKAEAVFDCREDAKAWAHAKNTKSRRNTYYVITVKRNPK